MLDLILPVLKNYDEEFHKKRYNLSLQVMYHFSLDQSWQLQI